jgi:Tropinone reductase 1
MSSRWRLEGSRCIVTGGSKGLGLACVGEFLELGASVLFTARGKEELERVHADLAKVHGSERVHCLAADVSTAEGRTALVSKASELWDGALDVLVNNVGTNDRKPAVDVAPAEYDAMVATNQTSAFFLCTLCLPLLRKSENGSVVNVSSLAGIRSSGTGVVYALTKAAMVHMSEALACEWAGHGVRVNCVCPWMVRTPLLEAAVAKDPTALDAAKAATPLGRLGEPADTAAAVSFLCMAAAKYITGQVVAVDGGLAAQGFRGPCVVPRPTPVAEGQPPAKRQK